MVFRTATVNRTFKYGVISAHVVPLQMDLPWQPTGHASQLIYRPPLTFMVCPVM